MNISSLYTDAAGRLLEESNGFQPAAEQKAKFTDILADALNMAEDTEKDSKITSLELLTGETDDIANVLIGAEKAEIALSLTVEIRNKVVDAYNEIMNMQV
jgi:flagellar hook-basal body complex protein FliE